uniref:hypothetical protein n=1 Tax=Aerococcus urinaeequi TaxID=51665 RepID=UPI00352A529A
PLSANAEAQVAASKVPASIDIKRYFIGSPLGSVVIMVLGRSHAGYVAILPWVSSLQNLYFL